MHKQSSAFGLCTPISLQAAFKGTLCERCFFLYVWIVKKKHYKRVFC